MKSSRPNEKWKTKGHITPRNEDRHEKDEQELDGSRKEGGGQSVLENAGSSTVTSLKLLLSLNSQIRSSSQHQSNNKAIQNDTNPMTSLNHSISSSNGWYVQ
ncbi:unnamed protein product [Schistosoma mattheei]|uniref:Uncharacterized protein n=1 Tax=Schistosoma mattheei TaxID=31246 RepID=A0A183NU85_9TREM|nr:unnamed protein product [Schistosoma mattheei]